MVRTAVVVVCGAAGLSAQTQQTPARVFDVVSVRPALSPSELGRQAAENGGQFPAVSFGIRTFPGGRLTAYANVRTMIARAYQIRDYQIEGGPTWLGDEYFAIEARARSDATLVEFNEMLKALLANRFGLRAHTSTRQGQVYNLVFARPDRRLGPALKPTPPECIAQIEARKGKPATGAAGSDTPPRVGQCGVWMTTGNSSGAITMSVSGQPLSVLVDSLSSELSAPVVDRTGLEGMFDFVVEHESQRMVLGRFGLDPDSSESPKPPLRNAIERQLGLKVEAAEGSVPILVIDAAERPMPN